MGPIKGDDGTPSGFQPTNPYGVWGDSGAEGPFQGGNGVVGSSALGSGVFGISMMDAPIAAGVYGQGMAVGVGGAVKGSGTAPVGKVGVYGSGAGAGGLGATGVMGESDTSTGVLGLSATGVGVRGESSKTGYNFGVVGTGPNAGVAAFNPNNPHAAYLASDCCAAWFTGHVVVAGSLRKSGGGFQIDHPLDPSARYLLHSFVESSEMKNVYDGVTLLDNDGGSTVELPAWFEALNRDFRYQLTSLGAAAPSLHVATEISDHRFRIAGGFPGAKVSWQVTGVRQDAWANAHRPSVEEQKSTEESGHYVHPELFGFGWDKSIARVRHETPTRSG